MATGTDLLLAGEPLVLGGDLNVASAYPLGVSAYAFTILKHTRSKKMIWAQYHESYMLQYGGGRLSPASIALHCSRCTVGYL
jgi:hypothetical protein